MDAAALRGGYPESTNRVEPTVYVVRPSSGDFRFSIWPLEASTFQGTPDALMREQATSMLADQAILAWIAMEDSDWLVRLAPVNKLRDRAVLTEVGGRG